MRCSEAEKLLHRSFDARLSRQEQQELDRHLEHCPACARTRSEYLDMLDILKTTELPDPKPYFWERLQPRLKEGPLFNPLSVWKQWGIRAIPASVILLVVFTGALVLLNPHRPEDLSPSEAFLLQNTNPLPQTSQLLDQDKIEDKNMMLIFASLEEETGQARYIP